MPLTVSEVIDHYLMHLRARVASGNFSAQALENMARDLLRFAGRFGSQTMDECRQHDLSSWLDANPQFASNHTRKRVLASVLRPFLWAEEEELIDASPYHKPKKLKLPTRPRRAAEVSEYVRIMRCRSRALRRALFFLRRSGARTYEMRDLLWDQVDLAAGIIEIDKHKTMRSKDDAPSRLIGLEPVLIRFLGNLKRRCPLGIDHVFLNAKGGPWKDRHVFDRHFRRWADRCGLKQDLCAYCFRHLYAHMAILADVGERQLADQMGHSSTRLIAYYAKTARNIAHLKKVAEHAMRRHRLPP